MSVRLPTLFSRPTGKKARYQSGRVVRKVPNTGHIDVRAINGKVVRVNDPDNAGFLPVGCQVINGEAAENFIFKTFPRLIPISPRALFSRS